MSLTRDITKAAQVLDKVKETLQHNTNAQFNRTSNQYDIGYMQACRDMQTRINYLETKAK